MRALKTVVPYISISTNTEIQNIMKNLSLPNKPLQLPRIGLGHIHENNPAGKAESIRTIHAAIDNGINYINTADFYDSGAHEMLLCEALKSRKREEVFISVKFGSMVAPNGMYYGIDVRPDAVKSYLAYSLKRLGTDYVDLYQPARISPHIPVEETIGAVADMVKAGYVRNVGISEIDGETLRRAHAVHPISLVEVQYSLLNRSIEKDLMPAARELGIGIVAFANLFHGLIGSNNPQEKLAALSRRMPAATVANLNKLIPCMGELNSFAERKGISGQQLAIAWVLAQGNDILALVGSRTVEQLQDTIRTADILLSAEELQEIEKIIPAGLAANSSMVEMKLDQKGLFIK